VRCVVRSPGSVSVTGVIHGGESTGWAVAKATILGTGAVTVVHFNDAVTWHSLPHPKNLVVGSGASTSFYLSPSQSRPFRFTVHTSHTPAACSVE
jgi:hypothetical protein